MNLNLRKPHLLNVASSSLMVGKLPGQMQYLRDRGFDVTIVSPAGNGLDQMARVEGVQTFDLPIVRQISPLLDLVSLWRLWRMMQAHRPAITNVGTPKAGLLGGLAAWLNRVPCRFYTLRGLRFETTGGLLRRLLIWAERLACFFAHRVICVSHSVGEKAIACGLTSAEKIVVLGSGSSNGVEVDRYASTPERVRRAAELRRELLIPASARVVGFVGRLTRDKGIPELVQAFLLLSKRFPDLRLLLLGRFEEEDPLPPETRISIETHPRIILAGYHRAQPVSHSPEQDGEPRCGQQKREDWLVDDAAPYYPVMDIFVLASHREGFPNVVLEAHAAGKPVVAARATGNVDAVLDGETGLLFPTGNVIALTQAVARLLQDQELAQQLARNGHQRVKREFRQEHIWKALNQEYLRLLQSKGMPLPAIHRLDLNKESAEVFHGQRYSTPVDTSVSMSSR